MTRPLVPFERRIVLLVRSRTKGMGVLLAVMAALALVSWRGDRFIYWAAGMAAMFVAVPLILSASPRELFGPESALWLHKPVREGRYIAARVAETMAASVGVAVACGVAAMAYGEALGWHPERPLGYVLPVGALASLVVASMAFGAAAWFRKGSRGAVVGLVLLSLLVFGPELNNPELERGGAVRLARVVLFPTTDLLRFTLGLTGDLPFRLQPLLACLAYAAGWTAFGALGVRRAVAAGRMTRAT